MLYRADSVENSCSLIVDLGLRVEHHQLLFCSECTRGLPMNTKDRERVGIEPELICLAVSYDMCS